jgi:hypothetical protein
VILDNVPVFGMGKGKPYVHTHYWLLQVLKFSPRIQVCTIPYIFFLYIFLTPLQQKLLFPFPLRNYFDIHLFPNIFENEHIIYYLLNHDTLFSNSFLV